MIEKKILIANDDELAMKSIARLCRTYSPNLKIDYAQDIDQAVELAKKNKYSMIVLDEFYSSEKGYGNEDIDGVEEIRQFDKETPIVLYSCLDSYCTNKQSKDEAKKYALDAGASYVIDMSKKGAYTLKKKIEEYLGK